MDYDDNDFQCQNFQLVGEDNNKFPPSFQTVPLPKFDLDEHLQVHLRFDSLVETEVLLGIQGRGNNWIEDFSTGDGAIEFRSSAAESCSNSRSNNVWSEATSSESVEMLLKSVGEDEMIGQKAFIKVANSHDGLNAMDGQMDTCLRQDNSNKEDIIYTDTTLSPDKCQKSFLGLDEDAVSVQPQVEGMPRTFNDENAGTDADVSSLGEKFNSEGKIVANECGMDTSLTSSSDYAADKSLVIDEVICETAQTDNPLHDSFMKCATDDNHCIVSSMAGDNSGSITCGTQHDPSSVSSGNPVMGPEKLSTQMLPEQVIEECSDVDTSEKFGLSAQKESSHIKDSEVNDPQPQGPAVETNPCSAQGSSILEPIMESLVLANDGCNEPVLSENPDGLLEAITYQVKALKEESQTMDKIAPETEKMYNLLMEGNRIIENKDVEISNEDDATNVRSTSSIENTNMVDERDTIFVEVTEEKHDHEVHLTENNTSDMGNTSQSTMEVHSSIGMSYAMPMKETKYDDGLGFSLLNLTSQHPNFIDIPEYTEIEVVKDIVKKAEVIQYAPQDILEESSSPALLDDAEKTSSSLHSKSFDLCDTDKLVADLYDVHKVPPEISTFTEGNTTPPVNSDIAKSNDGTSFVKEEMQNVSSADQKVSISTVMDCSSAMVVDESVAVGPASEGVNLHFLDNSTNVQESQPEDTLATVVIVEQKESTTPSLPASCFIQPDEKEVKISGSTRLNSSLDAQISRESVKVSESVVVDDSSMKDMIVEQKELTTSLPASCFIQPDEKEVEISGSTSLNSSLDAQISRESVKVSESVVDDSSMKDMIHDEPGVVSSIHFQQSESEDTMVVDVVVEQKEESAPSLPVSDFVHSDEKGISGVGVNSSINLQQSESEDIMVVGVVVEQKEESAPSLPVSDFVHSDEKGTSGVGVNSSINFQLSESEDTMVVDVDVEQKEESAQSSPVSDFFHSDEKGISGVCVNSLLNFQQSESEDTVVVDVVVEQKEDSAPSLPISDFVHSDEKGISGMPVSKCTMNTEILSEPTAVSDTVNDSPPVSPSEIRPILVGQSSSSMEGSVFVGCLNELQYSVDNPAMHGHPTRLEENNIAHTSVKGTGNTDSSGDNKEMASITSVESASNDGRQALPIPSSNISSSGDCHNRQESSEANEAPGDNSHRQNGTTQTEGDTQSRCTNSSPECLTPTRSPNGSHMLEAESASRSSSEQKCGSPTVISCSGHSQDEMYEKNNSGLPDRRDPLSDDLLVVSSETRGNVDKLKSNAHDSKESAASEDDRSFTFEVGSLEDLPERDTGNEWKPFSSIQPFEHSQTSKENSERRHLESEDGKLHGTITHIPDEDNSRQVSGYSTEKLTTKQGKSAKKTPIAKKTPERDGNPCSTSPKSVGTINGNMPLEEMQHYPYIESNLRATCTPTVPTSSLPDLNTSVSAAALFRQPFTDLQQVQLRAQIFVYGSLIQGIPPDEACMISAFGETDGGRGLWEGVWRVSAERYQNQASPFSSFETPSHSRSGTRVSEQVTKCNSLPSKASSIPASRIGSKVAPTAILNSTVPLPSPLWSISTRDGLHYDMPRVAHLDFNQALSPLHSHQSSQIRQYTGNSASWLSQSPRPGSRVVSSQSSTLDAATQYSALPITETVQLTPARDSSISHALNVPTVSPAVLLPTPGPTSVSAASVVHIGTPRKTTTPENNRSVSTVQKSRKRKKGSVPEERQPNILVSQPLADPTITTTTTGDTKHSPSASACLPMSSNSPTKFALGVPVSSTSTIVPPTYYKIIGSSDTENRATFSEETCSKIEQSRLLAEDAAALAASTVKHSQAIWSQLATLKKSGLVSEVDEKLASAAVAAAAAASVAKAAAAAAKVASDAALQAKMMADEALVSAEAGNLTKNSEIALQSLTRLTPVSSLKGKDKVHCASSIISAAREASRRRLEAASAATKRAENLDAIVKAAELAAEAVSQAGAIVAMGEPLPFTLSELVEAGPEGHWKFHSTTNELGKAKRLSQDGNMSLDGSHKPDKYSEQFDKQPSNNIELQKTTDEERMISFSEHSVHSEKHYKGNGSSIAPSTVPNDRPEKDHSANNHLDNSVQKGSLVEVVSDEDGLRGIWFSARVLDVSDGKAYVCYIDHIPDEGTGHLKEWILLEGEVNTAPRIRPAHPMTAAKYEGTRKRRREAIGNHVWAVGDRVDAWIRDGWREGIVTDRIQGDDTKLNVRFPARGDSSIVRAWNLRPSLVWKDGQWIEWSQAREVSLPPYEGDTPREKRQKLGRVEATHSDVDGKGVGELAKDLPMDDSRKPEESRPLMLSAKDRTFSIGKNTGGTINSDALKVRHTGLQKGGSKVIFGVPKPGKKRKFVEVSKHYGAGKTDKISEGNDSIKFAKYLMPQSSRIWRNSSKVDPKEKFVGDSKPKGLKSVKSQSIQTRSIAVKDNSSNGRETRTGYSNEQNNLEKKSLLEVRSFGNYLGTIESPHVEPSVQPVPGAPSSEKKFSSAVDVNIGVKGKLAIAVDKPTKHEEKSYEIPRRTLSDAPEPRRSNRRIQPTSRLLEGLQSSLIVSKIPNFSHDKGTKTQYRAAASSRGNTHG